jgi:hypothetical protein
LILVTRIGFCIGPLGVARHEFQEGQAKTSGNSTHWLDFSEILATKNWRE